MCVNTIWKSLMKIIIIYGNSQKILLNKRTFYKLLSHLAFWYTKMYTLIKHTVYKSLVKIQNFRHEWWSSIICNQIKVRSRYGIWHVDISEFVSWLDTHSVTVCWKYMLPNTNAIDFCDIFSKYTVLFPTCKNSAGNQKYGPYQLDILGMYT